MGREGEKVKGGFETLPLWEVRGGVEGPPFSKGERGGGSKHPRLGKMKGASFTPPPLFSKVKGRGGFEQLPPLPC